MSISLNELLHYDYFKSLELIAGANGCSRQVISCSILDYEMDRSVNQKYANLNFLPGQMVVTSLLFAKNAPFMIRDAVKYLVSKDVSALVIKNVFRLPVHESILRYADSKNFPIFLMDDTHMFFEDFIMQVGRCVEIAESTEMASREINALLYQNLNAGEKKARIHRIFPIFYDQYAIARFDTEHSTVREDYPSQASVVLKNIPLSSLAKSVLRYDKGFFLFLSGASIKENELNACVALLSERFPESSVGVSSIHFRMEDADKALHEAIYAARVHKLDRKTLTDLSTYQSYSGIGIYRVLLPLIDNEELQQYSLGLLDPVLEFDAENRGRLLETLLEFIQCGGDLHKLSARSGQHENTLRYRLDKVAALTGLNYRKMSDYEQLALAARVYLLVND